MDVEDGGRVMAGDLITGDFQLEWNGLRLGGPDTPYGVTEVTGLADLPGLVTADRPRLRRHGTIAGDDFLADRTVTVSLRIEAATADSTRAAASALASALAPCSEEQPLAFQIPGVADGALASIGARVRNKTVPVDLLYAVGIVEGHIQFVATDPRIYDAVETVQSVLLPTGDGGLDVPVAIPANLTAQTESGSMWIPNNGNFPSPWSARIDGPAHQPVIRNVTTGQWVGFDVTLADGEWLDIETLGARSVTLGGVESRYHTIMPGSVWWDMEPGVTELAFRAATATSAMLTVTSRSAWTS